MTSRLVLNFRHCLRTNLLFLSVGFFIKLPIFVSLTDHLLILLSQNICFQLEISNNIKTSLLQIRMPNICEHPLSQLSVHLLSCHTKQVFSLPWQTFFDSLCDLALKPQRHVNINPILQLICVISHFISCVLTPHYQRLNLLII